MQTHLLILEINRSVCTMLIHKISTSEILFKTNGEKGKVSTNRCRFTHAQIDQHPSPVENRNIGVNQRAVKYNLRFLGGRGGEGAIEFAAEGIFQTRRNEDRGGRVNFACEWAAFLPSGGKGRGLCNPPTWLSASSQ